MVMGKLSHPTWNLTGRSCKTIFLQVGSMLVDTVVHYFKVNPFHGKGTTGVWKHEAPTQKQIQDSFPCDGMKFLAPETAIFARKTFASPIAELSRGCFHSIHQQSGTYTKCTSAASARKSELFNTKVAHEGHFRSPGSKGKTFQYERNTLLIVDYPQPRLESRNFSI